MPKERSIRSGARGPCVLKQVVVLASCAGAIFLALFHHRLAASPPVTTTAGPQRAQSEGDDERSLIDSLVASASAAEGRSTPIRVAVFRIKAGDDNATKRLARILESESTCTWEMVGPADIRAGALERFDVVMFPGGSGSKQAAALGDEGKQAVRQFVRAGGGYVGICAGTFLATAKFDWSLGLLNAKTITGTVNVPGQGVKSMSARGAGTVKVELTDAGKSVLGDYPGLVDVQYVGGPILSPAARDDLPEYVVLAWYRTEIWAIEPQRGTMVDTPAIVAARFGKGRVIAFSPHLGSRESTGPWVTRAVRSTARDPVDVDGGARKDEARCPTPGPDAASRPAEPALLNRLAPPHVSCHIR